MTTRCFVSVATSGNAVSRLIGWATAAFIVSMPLCVTAGEPSASGIRVNQAGYFADGPKRATIISDAETPLPFQLLAADGRVIGEGTTAPRGVDPSSGLAVHTADFSALDIEDEGYRLAIGSTKSASFSVGKVRYHKLLVDSLSWFYPQRSGVEIDESVAGIGYSRAAGHADLAPNLGDGAVACLEGEIASTLYAEWNCTYRLDVRGGWYDAGDQGKYAVSGALAAAQLMSAYERAWVFGSKDDAVLGDGVARLPEAGNGVPDILVEARFEVEFLLRMTVPEGEPLAGMVHHKIHDTQWTALPMLPADDPSPRALHRPSTAATLDVAAASAQASRLFRAFDPAFADRLLAAARTAYAAARAHPRLFAPVSDGAQGGGDYADDNVSDEFYWAAAELFITTGERAFLRDLKASPHWSGEVFTGDGFDWRSVAAFARLHLGLYGQALSRKDHSEIDQSILEAADNLIKIQLTDAFGQVYAPKDNLYAWGSNHLMLQNANVLAAAYDLSGQTTYLQSARESFDYLLGRNALDLSYVTGQGSRYARNQHSRWYAHQLDPALPEPPPGALAGGPNSTLKDPVARQRLAGCVGQKCYVDDIGSWGTNEMAVNWNAALVQAAAFIASAR